MSRSRSGSTRDMSQLSLAACRAGNGWQHLRSSNRRVADPTVGVEALREIAAAETDRVGLLLSMRSGTQEALRARRTSGLEPERVLSWI